MTKKTTLPLLDLAIESANLHKQHAAQLAAHEKEAAQQAEKLRQHITTYNTVVENTLRKFNHFSWEVLREARADLLLAEDAQLTDINSATNWRTTQYVFTSNGKSKTFSADLFRNDPMLVAQYTRAVVRLLDDRHQEKKLAELRKQVLQYKNAVTEAQRKLDDITKKEANAAARQVKRRQYTQKVREQRERKIMERQAQLTNS
jgi:hypothetical protein